MTNHFFERPILNSPYEYPAQHWELDGDGQPTDRILDVRRRSDLITPVPKPKKRRRKPGQIEMVLGSEDGLSTAEQEYNPTPIINEIRTYVESWRKLPNTDQWQVTPETTRLLQHWRHHPFQSVRPFFCQIEAVETIIWLTEVAPRLGKRVEKFWAHIEGANEQANPELLRLALKLATGAGKTTVMAMLIAWQTVNAVRHPNSKTLLARLSDRHPGHHDPRPAARAACRTTRTATTRAASWSRATCSATSTGPRSSSPTITPSSCANGSISPREPARCSRGAGRSSNTLETEGQMLQRVMPDLMGLKNIVVLNDEAHHCYREKPRERQDEEDLKGEEKDEAKKNNEAARLWISGIEAVKRKLGLRAVYRSLRHAVLPARLRLCRRHALPLDGQRLLADGRDRVRHRQAAARAGRRQHPRRRHADVPQPLGAHRQGHAEEGARQAGKDLDPLSLPARAADRARRALRPLREDLRALAARPASTSRLSSSSSATTPRPRSSSTTTSPASSAKNDDGSTTLENGRLALFRNYDEHGNRLARPRTLLID